MASAVLCADFYAALKAAADDLRPVDKVEDTVKKAPARPSSGKAPTRVSQSGRKSVNGLSPQAGRRNSQAGSDVLKLGTKVQEGAGSRTLHCHAASSPREPLH
jgi:hypothetical protein